MKLTETSSMMMSNDYEERFKAEYFQCKIRIDGLKTMLEKWNNNTLSFTPASPKELYLVQLNAMETYLSVLSYRAKLEAIDLTEPVTTMPCSMDGHTKHLQGLDMPIMINSIKKNDTELTPSTVCEMHIGKFNDEDVLLITPDIIAL